MYYLVLYTKDKSWAIVSSNEIKRKSNGSYQAKWSKSWYGVDVLKKSEKKEELNNLCVTTTGEIITEANRLSVSPNLLLKKRERQAEERKKNKAIKNSASNTNRDLFQTKPVFNFDSIDSSSNDKGKFCEDDEKRNSKNNTCDSIRSTTASPSKSTNKATSQSANSGKKTTSKERNNDERSYADQVTLRDSQITEKKSYRTHERTNDHSRKRDSTRPPTAISSKSMDKRSPNSTYSEKNQSQTRYCSKDDKRSSYTHKRTHDPLRQKDSARPPTATSSKSMDMRSSNSTYSGKYQTPTYCSKYDKRSSLEETTRHRSQITAKNEKSQNPPKFDDRETEVKQTKYNNTHKLTNDPPKKKDSARSPTVSTSKLIDKKLSNSTYTGNRTPRECSKDDEKNKSDQEFDNRKIEERKTPTSNNTNERINDRPGKNYSNLPAIVSPSKPMVKGSSMSPDSRKKFSSNRQQNYNEAGEKIPSASEEFNHSSLSKYTNKSESTCSSKAVSDSAKKIISDYSSDSSVSSAGSIRSKSSRSSASSRNSASSRSSARSRNSASSRSSTSSASSRNSVRSGTSVCSVKSVVSEEKPNGEPQSVSNDEDNSKCICSTLTPENKEKVSNFLKFVLTFIGTTTTPVNSCSATVTSIDDQIELVPGYGVMVSKRKVNSIYDRYHTKPRILVRELYYHIVGRDKLANYSLTGRGGGTTAIPENIFDGIERFVNDKARKKKFTISHDEYKNVFPYMCGTLRNPKKSKKDKKNKKDKKAKKDKKDKNDKSRDKEKKNKKKRHRSRSTDGHQDSKKKN